VKRALVVATVALTACADAGLAPLAPTCTDDALCPAGEVCVFGLCLDPSDQQLSRVDIEIDGGGTLPVQSVFDVDLRTSPRVDIELLAGVLVTGSVVTAGAAPVDAVVVAQPPRSVPGRVLAPASSTDASGTFSLLAIDGLRYSMTISPSSAGLPPRYDIGFDAEADDGAGTQSLEPLLVEPGAIVVSGTVVAGEGAGAQGIDGLDVRVSAGGRRVSSAARTSLGGEFFLALPAPDVGLTLDILPTVDNPAFPRVVIENLVLDASVDLGELSLGAVVGPARFVARVVGADGAPVTGAVIAIRGDVGAGVFTTLLQADDTGAIEGSLPHATYQAIVVGPPQLASAGLLIVDELDVPSSNAEVVFTLPARVPFAGTVIDADGAALPAATLTLLRIGDVEGAREEVLADTAIAFSALSDALGQFSLAVDPGLYRVATRPPPGRGAPAFSERVLVGQNGLRRDRVLPARAVVAGSVSFAGAPVPSAYLRIFSSIVDERQAAILLGEGVTDDDGAFEIVVPDILADLPTPPAEGEGEGEGDAAAGEGEGEGEGEEEVLDGPAAGCASSPSSLATLAGALLALARRRVRRRSSPRTGVCLSSKGLGIYWGTTGVPFDLPQARAPRVQAAGSSRRAPHPAAAQQRLFPGRGHAAHHRASQDHSLDRGGHPRELLARHRDAARPRDRRSSG
jgi:hypothetical protein